MHHTMYRRTHPVQQHLNHRSIRASRTQNKLTRVNRRTLNHIIQPKPTRIHQILRHSRIIRLRIPLRQILREHIMTSRSQTITTHTTIILPLIRSLTTRRQTHNHIPNTNIRIINHIPTTHPARHRTIHNYRTNQIPHICRLTTRSIHPNTHTPKLSQQLIRTIDNRTDNLTRHQHLITPYRARHQYIIHRPHTQQVINIHNQRILRYPLPHRQVTRLTPISIRQRTLRARPVSMHDITPLRITTKNIRYNLTKSPRKQAFIYILDSIMHILLGGTNTAQRIPLLR